MGAGKLAPPKDQRRTGGAERKSVARDDEDEPTTNNGRLSFAQLVSQFLYAGKTLEQVARWDDRQMLGCIGLRRDKWGALVKHVEDLPPWVEVDDDGMRIISKPQSFGKMFRQVKKFQGLNKEKAEQAWVAYASKMEESQAARRKQQGM